MNFNWTQLIPAIVSAIFFVEADKNFPTGQHKKAGVLTIMDSTMRAFGVDPAPLIPWVDMTIDGLVGTYNERGVFSHRGEKPVPAAPDNYPIHKGGGYYTLSDGSTVKGKEAAQKAQQALDAPEE